MYVPFFPARSDFVEIRGLRHHFRHWGQEGAPLLLALHGWMDSSVSFQLLADRLADRWHIVAPDWRGFGQTQWGGGDSYEFGEYLGDLDGFCKHYSPQDAVTLMGHSMGGNVSMLFAGVLPDRVKQVINLEGLGMPGIAAAAVPERLRLWLSQIHEGGRLGDYSSYEDYAARLQRGNARLSQAHALFLAKHSGQNVGERWQLFADPAHKVVNRVAYRVEEVLACWRAIKAPVLWVEAADSQVRRNMLALDDYEARLAVVPDLERVLIEDAGHMLHHDQAARVAQLVADFLQAPGR